MYPPLLMMHAELSRRLIATRFRTITAAKDNAKETGYRGLRYPWESAFTGKYMLFHCQISVVSEMLLPSLTDVTFFKFVFLYVEHF